MTIEEGIDQQLASRLAGAVWGHLVGDAVGVPYEFGPARSPSTVHFGATGTHNQPPGTWSDDGALMLALLHSLLSNGFDIEDQGRRAVNWLVGGAYTPDSDGHFDVGATTAATIEAIAAGTKAEGAGGTNENANGNGSLMRILPVALVERGLSDQQLVDHALRASKVTHGTPMAQVACALYSLLVRCLLNGSEGPQSALERSWNALRVALDASREDSVQEAAGRLFRFRERSGRGFVPDSFWSAWDAFEGASNYREAIQRAVGYGNDTDSTAAIAGGLAGAQWGLEDIPREWLGQMRGAEIAEELVARLVATAHPRVYPNPIGPGINGKVGVGEQRFAKPPFHPKTERSSSLALSLRGLLPPESQAALEDLDDVLPIVKSRDVRFGVPWAPNVDLVVFLDMPHRAPWIEPPRVEEVSAGIQRLHATVTQPQALLAELHDLLPEDSRDERIGRRRWGLDDGEPHTLEDTGREFNVTRERIRQITKKLRERRFAERTAFMPATSAVIRLLDELGGAASLSDWGDLAYSRGLSESPAGPRAILELSDTEILDAPKLLTSGALIDPIVAVSAADLDEFERIGPIVRRGIRRQGYVDVSRAVEELNHLGIAVDAGEVDAYLRRLPALTRLNARDTYLDLDDLGSPLWRAIEKMLSAAAELSAEKLSTGLLRTRPGRQAYAIEMSASLLTEVLDRSPLVQGAGGLYSWAGPTFEPDVASAESHLLALFKAEGPIVRYSRIREFLEDLGYSLPTVSSLLRGSHLIEKVSFATYALLGSIEDDETLDAALAGAMRMEIARREQKRQTLEDNMASKLREAIVPIDDLFLDPNNPRFADLDTLMRPVPESRVHEETVQKKAMGRMLDDRFEVQQLQDSIRSIGFLTVDRIVAVELPEPGKFMVIEGNRRLAAIKAVLEDHAAGELDLEPEVMDSLTSIPLMIIDDPNPQTRNFTARVLQGVRHVASVKPWGPYQQAQLVGLMLDEGEGVAEIKETLGLTAARINSLRRVYYAREQMRGDSEFGELAKPGLFSNFEEALKLPKIRAWLEWDDDLNKALNTEHRQMLYGWFVGVEDEGVRLPAKIIDAKDIRKLPALLDNPVAFQRFVEDPKLSLSDAARSSGIDDAPHLDWRALILSNVVTLENVPALDLRDATDEDVELLNRVKSTVDALLKQLEFARGSA